jgi:hypothetical protein
MYLESIESDNYKPLPGGIFNKGFVKSYAKYVGLDEQEALQEYARLVAQNEETIEDSHPRYRPEVLTDDARSASSIVTTVVFAAIILALMTVGILFAVNYIRNQPSSPAVVSNTSSNTASNSANAAVPGANTNANPIPDGIRVEFKALSEKIAVTATVDGNVASDEVVPEAPKVYTAQESIKLRYYRGFADKVQITLNGKPLAPPTPPTKGNIEIEINRENVARIFESGQITPGAPVPVATATPTVAPTTVATPAPTGSTPVVPRPTATTPRPAFTPVPTPRRTPTPIVVGKPTPSPN